MPHLYGEPKSDEEIITFIRKRREGLMNDPRQRYHVLMGMLPSEPARLLDYGCGWGINAVGAWDRDHDVTAIDVSQNEVDICKLVWGKKERLAFDRVGIDKFPDQEFDCVLSAQVIEHVHNIGAYLTGINRVLRPEGSLIISTPIGINPRNIWRLLRRNLEAPLREHSTKLVRDYDKTHDHIHSWDQFHFVRLLASCGFELEQYEPAEGVPLPWSWKKFIRGNGYWYGAKGRLRNLSNTMVFRFRKVKDVRIVDDQ